MRRRPRPPLEFWLWLAVIGLVATYAVYLARVSYPFKQQPPLDVIERKGREIGG